MKRFVRAISILLAMLLLPLRLLRAQLMLLPLLPQRFRRLLIRLLPTLRLRLPQRMS